MYYILLQFQQNLVEFSKGQQKYRYQILVFQQWKLVYIYRVSQSNPVTAQQNLVEFSRLPHIAADYGLVTGLDRWVYIRSYIIILNLNNYPITSYLYKVLGDKVTSYIYYSAQLCLAVYQSLAYIRKFFFGRVVASENQGLRNLRKSQFAAICSDLLQTRSYL